MINVLWGRAMKPTILVDGHVFDGFFQGTRTYLLGLYKALALRHEFKIIIAANDLPGVREEFSGCPDVDFVEIPRCSTVRRLFLVYPRLIRRLQPDYMHFQYVGPIFKGKSKLIITMHDILFCDFKDEFSLTYRIARLAPFWFFSKFADILLTVSEYSKSRISQVFAVNEKEISVVSNAVDARYFENSLDGEQGVDLDGIKSKFVLYVSRIEPRKNHNLLVRAYRDLGLSRKGYQLVFVGKRAIRSGELENEMSLLTDDERENVLFMDGVSQERLALLYKKCTLFVFPSRGEGFGIPVIEAAASGASVLTSNATAMGMLGLPDINLFDPNDYSEMRMKIQDALTTGSKYQVPRSCIEGYQWASSAEYFSRRLLGRCA